MASFSNTFFEEIKIDDFLSAALHHRSAKDLAPKNLRTASENFGMLDVWVALAKSVINLYATNLAINSSECRTPAKATLARNCINSAILKRISDAVSEIAVFGPGVKRTGREASSLRESVALQLIGALAFSQGYSAVIKKIFSELPSFNEVSIAVEKDSKSLLQESFQKQYGKLPVYEIVNISGPANSQTFTSKVSGNGQSATGIGVTRRSAEQDAAQNYICNILKLRRIDNKLNFSQKIDISTLARSLPNLKNSSYTQSIIEKLNLPEWNLKIFQIAFVHSSYDLNFHPQPLGKDNKLLAFIGSEVLQWLAKDSVAKGISLKNIVLSGGVTPISTSLVSENVLCEIFKKINPNAALLLGKGEKTLLPSAKAEFVQAYVGALFLAKEGVANHCLDLIHLDEVLKEHFVENIEDFALPRDTLLSPKTLFQERCQQMHVALKYETRTSFKNGRITVYPIVRLSSPWLKEELEINGDSENSVKNAGRKKMEIESDMASASIAIVDDFIGTYRVFTGFSESQPLYIQRWFLMHCLGAIKAHADQGIKHGEAKNTISDFLGVRYIKQNDFLSFSTWHHGASKILNLLEISDFQNLFNFFEWVGNNQKSSNTSKRILGLLNSIESMLLTADPLGELDIRRTEEFKDLVKEALVFKILGSALKVTTVPNLISDSKLIFKEITIYSAPTIIEDNVEFLMLDGVFIALLSVFFNDSIVSSTTKSVELSLNCDEMTIEISKKSDVESSILNEIHRDPLWQILKKVMPVIRSSESNTTVAITVCAYNHTNKNSNIFRYWLAYNLQGNLGVAKSDTAAAMLHDLKNFILGYASASQNAKSVLIARERYAIAAQASKHAEEALNVLTAIKSLVVTTRMMTINEFSGEEFFKSAVASILSWVPREIKLKVPLGKTVRNIWTSQAMLKSVFNNLVKNAVEAMPHGGTLSLDYHVSDLDDTFEIMVSDTGPGFSHIDLITLNNGLPISTKKGLGQGIGILTVLLLTKELGGLIQFENNTGSGSTIIVRVPSMPSEEIITESTEKGLN